MARHRRWRKGGGECGHRRRRSELVGPLAASRARSVRESVDDPQVGSTALAAVTEEAAVELKLEKGVEALAVELAGHGLGTVTAEPETLTREHSWHLCPPGTRP